MPYNENQIVPKSLVRIPKDSYRLRIIEVTRKASNASGLEMLVLKCELTNCKSLPIEVTPGKVVDVDVNGLEVAPHYMMLEGKSDSALIKSVLALNDLLEQAGMPLVDTDSITSVEEKRLVGVEFSAGVMTVDEVQMKEDRKTPIYKSIPGHEHEKKTRMITKITDIESMR